MIEKKGSLQRILNVFISLKIWHHIGLTSPSAAYCDARFECIDVFQLLFPFILDVSVSHCTPELLVVPDRFSHASLVLLEFSAIAVYIAARRGGSQDTVSE